MRKQVEIEYCDYPDCDMSELHERLVEHTISWDGEDFTIKLCESHESEVAGTFDSWITYQLQPVKVTERRQERKSSKKPKTQRAAPALNGIVADYDKSSRADRAQALRQAGFAHHSGRFTKTEMQYLREKGLI